MQKLNPKIEQLKTIMKKNGITQKELAEKSKIPIQTIAKIFAGFTTNPRVDTLQAIESALILDSETNFNFWDISNIESLPEFNKVPLLGTIACGTPILATENIEEYINIDRRIHADFALRCKGDSMILARIHDGDIVYIRQQDDVENGEIAAVLIANEATLKRVYKYENRVELRPENPTFAPLNFEGDELKQMRILGKAVAFLSVVK
ncbi:MAG: transcriptional repressor LexA [Corallococcus sp.]|nr:transcriptional repressor LexA [Corallococcus sp.]